MSAEPPPVGLDLVEREVELPTRTLSLLVPRDAEALLDEKAFEQEEFLPYWAELWPSAVALAEAVSTRPLAGARVLELGCGLRLPSIAAALAGARVLAADWSQDAISLLAVNAARNGAKVEAELCSWADADPLAARGPWDVVLAADVLYERRNVELLVALLPRLIDERGEVLVADPGRPPLAAFLEQAAHVWQVESQSDASRVALYTLRQPPR